MDVVFLPQNRASEYRADPPAFGTSACVSLLSGEVACGEKGASDVIGPQESLASIERGSQSAIGKAPHHLDFTEK